MPVGLSRSAFPGGWLFLFHQSKINLPVLQINPIDPNLDRVAEPEGAAMMLADEGVLLLIIDVIIVMQIADVNQPFDKVSPQLDEEAVGRDAGDEAIVRFADLIRHELHLLPLNDLPLGLHGGPLPLRSVFADFREAIGPRFLLLLRHPLMEYFS